MTRILIRAGKEPWVPVTPETSLAANVIGTNSGNAVFSTGVFSALATPDAELEADFFRVERGQTPQDIAARISDEYDHVVLPFANAFRGAFLPYLDRWTDVIGRLTIPVTVAGIGGQFSSNDGEIDIPQNIGESASAFMRAALAASPSVGVRGVRTQQMLDKLGFGPEHVEVIGCPSMYRADRPVVVKKNRDALDADSRLALSVTPRMARRGESTGTMATLVARAQQEFTDVTYVAQDGQDLAMLMWGDDPGEPKHPGMPIDPSHSLVSEDRMRFFVDPERWFDHLSPYDFLLGSRIHGAIASLIAGTPAYVLAFDSRTRELSEYHAIPHRILRDTDPHVPFADLYEEFDEAKFADTQARNQANYVRFLESHTLRHTLDDPALAAGYRERLAAASLPPGVGAEFVLSTSIAVQERLRWMRQSVGNAPARQELEPLLPSWAKNGGKAKRGESVGPVNPKGSSALPLWKGVTALPRRVYRGLRRRARALFR